MDPNLEIELNKKEWENHQLAESLNKLKNDFFLEKKNFEKKIEDSQIESLSLVKQDPKHNFEIFKNMLVYKFNFISR